MVRIVLRASTSGCVADVAIPESQAILLEVTAARRVISCKLDKWILAPDMCGDPGRVKERPFAVGFECSLNPLQKGAPSVDSVKYIEIHDNEAISIHGPTLVNQTSSIRRFKST